MLLNGFNDRGALTQLLMRRLNMTGNAPVPVLMPELGSNLVLESDRPEWGFLKDENHFSLGVPVAALAAEIGIVWMPPVSDQMIRVVTDIYFSPAAANTLTVIGRTSAPAITLPISLSNPSNVDDRAPDNVSWAISSGTNAATPAATRTYAVIRAQAAATVRLQGAFIVTNRTGLCLYSGVVNSPFSVTVRGYYRRAQPGELV